MIYTLSAKHSVYIQGANRLNMKGWEEIAGCNWDPSNPIYLRGRDQKMVIGGQLWQIVLEALSQKYPT
jgi:hypothetical protein